MPKLYWRSDARTPEEVFKYGFTPRTSSEEFGDKKDWWAFAINAPIFKGHHAAVDAFLECCICLSNKFESAALFPLNEEKTYIYAVALPEASSVLYAEDTPQENKDFPSFQQDSESKKVYIETEEGKTPADINDVIIDLHSLQTTQAYKAEQFLLNEPNMNIGVIAGWPLYAYEAIAHHVSPENIICAVEISPEKRVKKPEITSIFFPKPAQSLDRTFRVDRLIENPAFEEKGLLKVIGEKDAKQISYIDERETALNMCREFVSSGKLFSTPNIYYGLGGKILGSPLTIKSETKEEAAIESDSPRSPNTPDSPESSSSSSSSSPVKKDSDSPKSPTPKDSGTSSSSSSRKT